MAAGLVAALGASGLIWWRLSGHRTKPGRYHLPRIVVETRPADLPPVELVAPRGDIVTLPVFEWKPFAGALGYRVTVTTDTGTPMISRDVTAPPLEWPKTTMTAPGGYIWSVEARSGKGIIAASPPTSFRILP